MVNQQRAITKANVLNATNMGINRRSHRLTTCDNKSKCFRCNKYRHKSLDCKKKKLKKSKKDQI